MIQVNVPSQVTGAVIMSFPVHGTRGDSGTCTLGTGPVMLTGDSFQLDGTSYFSEEGQSILNENPVQHHKVDGELVCVDKSLVKTTSHYEDAVIHKEVCLKRTDGYFSSVGGLLCGPGKYSWRDPHYDADNSVAVVRRGLTYGAMFFSHRKRPSENDHAYGMVGVCIIEGPRAAYRSYYIGRMTGESTSALRTRVKEEMTHLMSLPFDNPTLTRWRLPSFAASTLNKKSVYNQLRHRPFAFKWPRSEDSGTQFGLLVRKAVEAMDVVDYNTLDFAVKLKNIKSLMPPVRDLKGMTKGEAKGFANVYLWIRYGLTLTASNIMSLTTDIPDLLAQAKSLDGVVRISARSMTTVQDHDGNWSASYVFSAYVDQYPHHLGQLGRTLSSFYSMDAMPTAQNLWDMIPYSFVLDWLIPIDDVLNNVDFALKKELYKVHVAVSSVRMTRPRKVPFSSDVYYFGQLTDVIYRRTVTPTLPTLGVFEENTLSKFGVRRAIDATALTIQRLG